MKMLKRVDVFMLLVIGAIIGTLVLWFVWITLMSVSAQGTVECQANETCYWLMHADSQSYILCSDGEFAIEVFSVDALLQTCANSANEHDPYPGSTPRPTPTIAPFPQPNVIERAWLPIVLGGN